MVENLLNDLIEAYMFDFRWNWDDITKIIVDNFLFVKFGWIELWVLVCKIWNGGRGCEN